MKNLIALYAACLLTCCQPQEPPQPGVVIAGCKITRVLDADTVQVEVTRRFMVRFRDCWAPETHETKHPSEKQLGLRAKEVLEHMAPVGTSVTLEVATDGDDDIGDGLTFGRVVGDLWSDRNLSTAMIDSGHCYRTKAELEAYLTRQDSLE
jgi:endonuclease YncB( thermonuclease family)